MRPSPFGRRAFVAAMVGACAAPLAAAAQPVGKVYRIGLLGAHSPAGQAKTLEALRAGLHDLGYVEGKNVVMENSVFAERGAHVLDAPVSGGPSGAKSGRLAIWVGGDRAVFEKHRALLDAMGDQASYVGPIGAGSVAKLVHNCASFTIRVALAEVFCMGVKAGVEPAALWKAVRQGNSGRKRTFDGLAEKFLPGIYEPPSFALKLGHKDVSLATALGRELGVPMRLANLALAEIAEALNRGWGDRDSSSFMLLEAERAGVEMAASPEVLKKILAEDGA